MNKIKAAAAIALVVAASGCTELGYRVEKVMNDTETGRSYLVCSRDGSPSVEHNVTADTAFHTRVGDVCLDDWVEGGVTVTPSSTPTSQPATT